MAYSTNPNLVVRILAKSKEYLRICVLTEKQISKGDKSGLILCANIDRVFMLLRLRVFVQPTLTINAMM